MSFSLVLIITVIHHHCLLSSLKTKSHIEILSWLLTIKNVKIAAIGINQFLVFPYFCMAIIVSKKDWGKNIEILTYWTCLWEKKKYVTMRLLQLKGDFPLQLPLSLPSHTFHSTFASKSSQVFPLTLIRHLYSKLTLLFYCHLREYPWRFRKRNWPGKWLRLFSLKRQSSWNKRDFRLCLMLT